MLKKYTLNRKKIRIKCWEFVALLMVLSLPMQAERLNEENSRRFDYFFMEACRLKMKGDLSQAGEMLQNCLKIDPNSAASHFELGKLFLITRDEKNAIQFLRRATSLNPKNAWYQEYLAGVFEHAKQLPQAIEVYENLRKNEPEKVEYYYRLGALYTGTEQYDKAVVVYDEMEKLEGVSEPLILEKQRLYLLSGDEKKALAEVRRLVAEYPKEARYWVLLGDFYTETGDHKKAKKAFDKAADLDKDNGFLHMSLAAYYEAKGDKKSADKELLAAFGSQEVAYEHKMQILAQYMMMAAKDSTLSGKVENLTAELKANYPERPNTYFLYANYLLQDSSKTALVEENLKKTVSLDAANEEAWMLLVQLAFGESDFEKVLDYTQDAELNGIKTPHVFFYRGIAAQQLKNFHLAKSSFEHGIAITTDDNPLKPQLLGSLGDVCYELDQARLAFGYYGAALALDGHNVMVMNNYAYYLAEEDTLLSEAERMSAKCVELEPGNATFLDTYAWILYKRGNFLLAKFYMEKAIHNAKEENEVLFDHYGDILSANGDKEEARKFWQKAIDAGGEKDLIVPKLKN